MKKKEDAAIAEANTLVAGLQEMSFEVRSEANDPVPQSIKDQHTANDSPTSHLSCLQPTEGTPSTPHPLNDSQTQADASDAIMHPYFSPAPQPSGPPPRQSFKQYSPSPAHPPVSETPYRASHDQSTTTIDLIKYLARNRLVTSGLTTYDDQPMNYWAWKTSFQNAIANLDLSAAEELDLLNKYLGKESAEQVRRI